MDVPWWMIIPFAVMLLSIAILPLIPATAHYWEQTKYQLGLSLLLGIPVAIWVFVNQGGTPIFHTAVEYMNFIVLLFSLFVVSGGIFMDGDVRPTPRNNSIILGIGGVIASFIGTTGAAMLLIRPILNINKRRHYKVHTIIFTILIVANNGGMLTPLGDPPLFLGFLRGVPFTWTFTLLPMWAFINGLLLLTYYFMDRRAYATEGAAPEVPADQRRPISFRGLHNLLFFAIIIVSVALIPSMNLEAIDAGTATVVDWIPWRDLTMLAAAAGSFFLTSRSIRYGDNEFSWGPIAEVAAIFIGIFLTMMPALQYLAQIAPTLPLNDVTFFVFSGGLSAVLDNAPTYVTFFEMAGTLPGEPRIAGVPESYLIAISLGSVACGALTYIGNGPNFMVKSVADNAGVTMPSFGGYMVWSLRYLAPILTAMVLIFIANAAWTTPVGIVLAILLVVLAVATSGRPMANAPTTKAGDSQ